MVPGTRMSQFSMIMTVLLSARSFFPLRRISMKPTRIRMCHSLVMNYGLYKRMEIFVSERGSVLVPVSPFPSVFLFQQLLIDVCLIDSAPNLRRSAK